MNHSVILWFFIGPCWSCAGSLTAPPCPACALTLLSESLSDPLSESLNETLVYKAVSCFTPPIIVAESIDIWSINFIQVISRDKRWTKSNVLFCLHLFPNPWGNNGKEQLREEGANVNCCSGDRVSHKYLLLLTIHCAQDFFCHLHWMHTVFHLSEKDYKIKQKEWEIQTCRHTLGNGGERIYSWCIS